jgi:hypothetical protein
MAQNITSGFQQINIAELASILSAQLVLFVRISASLRAAPCAL